MNSCGYPYCGGNAPECRRCAQSVRIDTSVSPAPWSGRTEAARSEEQIIAEFLERSGQYVTNDATREAAIADATNGLRKQLTRLYLTAQDVCACVGYHGSIGGRDDRMSRLMDALAAIDGGSQDGAPKWMQQWVNDWEAAKAADELARVSRAGYAEGNYVEPEK